jgi:hypothetical protein
MFVVLNVHYKRKFKLIPNHNVIKLAVDPNIFYNLHVMHTTSKKNHQKKIKKESSLLLSVSV